MIDCMTCGNGVCLCNDHPKGTVLSPTPNVKYVGDGIKETIVPLTINGEKFADIIGKAVKSFSTKIPSIMERVEMTIPLEPTESEKIQEHLANWVYNEARKMTEQVRTEQILKGAAKYPKPLGDATWTALELVQHGLEENIDQNHYLVMLHHEIKKMNDIIEKQAAEIKRLEQLLNP